jgi:hypothetical protein
LFVLDNENVGLQQALNNRRDVLVRKSVGAFENPGRFRHRDDADETQIFWRQPSLDPRACFC